MRQSTHVLGYIAALALLPATALAQGGPDKRKCPNIESSRAGFAAISDEPSAIAATIAHIARTEGTKSVTATRRKDLAELIKGIGWSEHKQQSLRDMAADWKMHRC